MSIGSEIIERFSEVDTVKVTKADLHGEDTTKVLVGLMDGRTVEGNFAKHPRDSFGGIVFSGPKDVVELMCHKIKSVLEDTYERNN